MAIPDLYRTQAERLLTVFCEERIPEGARDQLRLSHDWRGNSVTLKEHRPVWNDPSRWSESVVAQFRFNATSMHWQLYCADRNSRWHPYDHVEPSLDFAELLREVDSDPTGIFWG